MDKQFLENEYRAIMYGALNMNNLNVIVSARNVDDNLINISITTTTIEDFIERLETYLPKQAREFFIRQPIQFLDDEWRMKFSYYE